MVKPNLPVAWILLNPPREGQGEVCQLLENVMFHAELNLIQLTAHEF